MTTITVHRAKTELSKLIARAEAGEEIVIARRDKPAVRLEPIVSADKKVTNLLSMEASSHAFDIEGLQEAVEAGMEYSIKRNGLEVAKVTPVGKQTIARRKPGALKGMFSLPDSFFDPLPEDELKAWEGKHSFDADT